MINTKKINQTWDIESLANYVSEIVAKESGNVLGENQKSMVLNRLKKRLIDLGELEPSDYYDHLIKNYNREATHLVSLLTTHHTFFFREFCHFEYILQNLDSIVKAVQSRGDNKISILSAACSRGQEVYSLAMFFNYHLKKYPGIQFEILGTDIDPESVKIGLNGVYPYNEVKSIPQVYLEGNWQRGTGDISRFAKIKSHLKEFCTFKVMNLLRPEEVITSMKFDIIFCRNVFIYFNMGDVEKIVNNLKQYLHQNALFITGLSESLKSLSLPKQTFAPSVYCFDEPTEDALESVVEAPRIVSPVYRSLIPKPIRVLAVDDSSSVLKLLTKVFSSDADFELVGTATNGIEAEEFLKYNNIDAMTLDIHMPEMDGVEYLKKNYKKGHPHVVIVSSASREDARYAQQTLRNGASDFVEKPALNNLSERAEEIKNKIKMSFLNANPHITELDKDFTKSFKIENASNKGRAFIGSFSDKNKLKSVLAELSGEQPPIFLFFEGNSNFLEMFKTEIDASFDLKLFNEENEFKSNSIYLCDFKADFVKLGSSISWDNISLSIFGVLSKTVMQTLIDLEIGQILLEDNELITDEIREVVTDIFPWTSFSHVGTEYLAKKK